MESVGRPRVVGVGVGSGGGKGIFGPARIGCTFIFTLSLQVLVNFNIIYRGYRGYAFRVCFTVVCLCVCFVALYSVNCGKQ